MERKEFWSKMPWKSIKANENSIMGKVSTRYAIVDADDREIARTWSVDNEIKDKLNGSLMAAAPEMLCVLREFEKWWDANRFLPPSVEMINRLRNVILKAIGKSATQEQIDAVVSKFIHKNSVPNKYRCTVCGINYVDAENGYDTCPECEAKI